MSATASLTVGGVEGVQVAYERQGVGPPLLLLHGIGHHRQAWAPVVERLAGKRDVVAIDFPGFGESPDVPAALPDELDTFAAVLDAFCRELGIERPHVAGNSMGGMVALRLGQLGLARSVTALSPAGFWTPRQRTWALNVLTGMRRVTQRTPEPTLRRMARTPAGRRVMTGMIYHHPAQRTPEAVYAESLSLRDGPAFDRVAAYARRGTVFEGDVPGVPVTIAWGTHDRILPRSQALRAHHQIPQARIVSLAGCGHIPMNDAPGLVAHILLQGSSARATAAPGPTGA
ncbi:alpha/beta fold hydrolase [Kribbella sp. NPDC051770]|uniref:alpha/beta fold hydrolase n=1 Tax=Kribbella sp. NPDC051770 TaxID=3155413 RepID=UPI00341F4748